MSSLHWIDWVVLLGTLLFIVIYGTLRTRGSRNIAGYLKGDNTMKWGTIGLSVMATQASAITFLSTPGQAYKDGMAFVQNYFGLPIALIIVCVVFIPLFYRLNVYTAYEFLEKRFDLKTRLLGALIFLLQRGLSAGITIYAPSIIISAMLGWPLNPTIIIVGIMVIIYTVTGGTKAVSLTQKYQMAIIFFGMFTAFFMLIDHLPEYLSFGDAVKVAGKMGKLEAVDFSLDLSKRYTFWSGITGGLFLSLSYFGTDQSQVQRYITGSNTTESRMGLLFNAVLKIPMQFFILFMGAMVFVFYQFEQPPVFFKQHEVENIRTTQYAEDYKAIEDQHNEVFEKKREAIRSMVMAMKEGSAEGVENSQREVLALDLTATEIREDAVEVIRRHKPEIEAEDADYVFLTFIMNYLPRGIIGLLLAVILSAAMSSTSSELNALASTTMVDYYKRLIVKNGNDYHYVKASRVLTAFWGLVAISFAVFAYLVENLIEAVNIVGSLFYGTILGIFLVAFLIKRIKGTAVFIAALIAESVVITVYFLGEFGVIDISYLLYNVIGCVFVIVIGYILQFTFDQNNRQTLDQK